MEAMKLYVRLEKDFIKPSLSDKWAQNMGEIQDCLSDNFKKRSTGIVCDNSEEIKKVYTAVFPTESVMKKILDKKGKNALLFLHHPMKWNMNKNPFFQNMNRKLLEQFRKRKISIYSLHVPLDNFGEYSTSMNLAKAIGAEPQKPFAYYYGALCGVFAETECRTIQELSAKLRVAVGHKVSLYDYGGNEINDGMVAVVAGGGNDVCFLEEIAKEGISTFVTGITALNEYSKKAHDYAREKRINLLGGTHYSTEKFACIAMRDYFRKLGLKSEFINGIPGWKDL